MAGIIQFTEPTSHPAFVREQKQITALMTRILVRGGWTESQATREAEAMLAPRPPAAHRPERPPMLRRAGGAS